MWTVLLNQERAQSFHDDLICPHKVMVNSIKDLWKIKENANRIIILSDAFSSLSMSESSAKWVDDFFKSHIDCHVKNLKYFKEGLNSSKHLSFKNLWKNIQYISRSVIIEQHRITTFVHSPKPNFIAEMELYTRGKYARQTLRGHFFAVPPSLFCLIPFTNNGSL